MPKVNPKTLQKLNLYKRNPDIVQPLNPGELADVLLMLIDAINNGKLDGYTPQPGKDYLSKEEAITMLTKEVNKAVNEYKDSANTTASELQKMVSEAVANIKNGENGIVTEEEIRRAAEAAALLIEVPDFERIIQTEVTSDGFAIRDALELITEEDDKLEQSAVKMLPEELQKIWDALAEVSKGKGGTIGKQQVLGFIAQSGTWQTGTGTPQKMTVSATAPENPSLFDIWVNIS